MEMNRYLIAALYVMAGCAVTVPLKAQPNGELLRGDRCRLVITDTVKVVSACLEQEEKAQKSCRLSRDTMLFAGAETNRTQKAYERRTRVHSGSLCRTSHKIRAPEGLCR